jgi:hypothetical protein
MGLGGVVESASWRPLARQREPPRQRAPRIWALPDTVEELCGRSVRNGVCRLLARDGGFAVRGRISPAHLGLLVIDPIDAGHRDTAQARECGHSEGDAEHEGESVPHLDDPHAATV